VGTASSEEKPDRTRLKMSWHGLFTGKLQKIKHMPPRCGVAYMPTCLKLSVLAQVTTTNFSFKAEDYELFFDFFGTVDSETSAWKIGAREVAFVFMRDKPGEYWDKLHKGKRARAALSAVISRISLCSCSSPCACVRACVHVLHVARSLGLWFRFNTLREVILARAKMTSLKVLNLNPNP
jgi:hypothetical protein